MAMEQAVEMMRGGSFERMRQKILKYLRDPTIEDFSVLGWEGVGRSMITRQAVDELAKKEDDQEEEEEEGESSLFDHIIWLQGGYSLNCIPILVETIAKAMGIDIPKGRDEALTTAKIFFSSENRRFLIIADGEDSSASELRRFLQANYMPNASLKVVEILSSMGVSPEIGSKGHIVEKWASLSDDEAWTLLCHEIAEVSDDPDVRIYLTDGGDSAMQCLFYLLLFSNAIESSQAIWWHWKSEGFIHHNVPIEREEAAAAHLVTTLQYRGMIEVHSELNLLPIHPELNLLSISGSMRSKLIQILDRRGTSSCCSPWKGIKLRSSLVRCGLQLQKAPKVDEWEQGNLERVSLDSNKIETLIDIGPSPKCPCLSTLILSHNPLLRQIPEDFFQHMQGLRVLDLSHTSITSLPSSLSSLTNIRLLAFEHCPLDTLLFSLLQALQKLEVLLLGGCLLPGLEVLFLNGMQSLRYLNINLACSLKQLSLKGCHSFVLLKPPISLEILDLSGTKIKDFTHFCFSDLPHLRCLDLVDTKSLTTVPWHQIDRLPKALNWDQCGHRWPREEQLETKHGYCICVSDDKIFQTLSKDSMLWKNDLKKFRISVILCDHRQQQHPKDKDNPFERIHFIYRDIIAAKTKHFTKFVRSYNRSLEIGSTNDVPLGIRGVLYQTEFLSLFDNKSITRLSQLGVENLDSLIECRFEKCQTMQSLLTIGGSGSIQAFSRLENLLVFNLTNLKSLCNGRFGEGSFSCLKYIRLEHCPRLSSLFTLRVRLEKLEILEIRFCDKLERVFEEDDVTGEDVFPLLKELCLWELRKLKSICSGDLPTLEKVRIHGCRLLHKLPLLSAISNKLMSIVITGERAWHQNLK